MKYPDVYKSHNLILMIKKTYFASFFFNFRQLFTLLSLIYDHKNDFPHIITITLFIIFLNKVKNYHFLTEKFDGVLVMPHDPANLLVNT